MLEMKMSISCLIISPLSSASSFSLHVSQRRSSLRLFTLYLCLWCLKLVLFCLENPPLIKINHRDAICSDPSKSRRGHTCACDIRQVGEKGKNRKVSSRGALQLVTLLSADEAVRRFTRAGSPPRGRGDACADTRLCINACTCSGRRQLYDRFWRDEGLKVIGTAW